MIRTVDLKQFQPGCAAGTLMLDLDAQYSGDVTEKFVPYTQDAVASLVKMNSIWQTDQNVVTTYPAQSTQCTDQGAR